MSGLENAMKTCWFVDLGLLEYDKAVSIQKQLVAAKAGSDMFPNVLLLLEHPPSITFGVNGNDSMLRFSRQSLKKKGIGVYKNDPELMRGGKVTYHGPGQVVGYPIVSITSDEHASFIKGLEQTMLETALKYGVVGAHTKLETDKKGEHLRGTWCSFGEEYRKLGSRAIGQKYSSTTGKHITFHGFAFNVNTDLSHFDVIDPCGMKDEKMTSLQQVLRKEVNIDEVKQKIAEKFGNILGYTMLTATPEALNLALLQLKK